MPDGRKYRPGTLRVAGGNDALEIFLFHSQHIMLQWLIFRVHHSFRTNWLAYLQEVAAG